MSDAIALFHPSRREALVPFLDLDDENEESEGIYAEALDDGSFLLHTFQPFEIFATSPDEARAWFDQFGDALSEVHDDPRGVLFFPDTLEPEAQTYAGVVDEIGEEGIFVSLAAELADDGLDMDTLQAIAAQLLGAAPDGSTAPKSSFEIAKMMEGVHEQLLASLGLEAPNATSEQKLDDSATAEPSPKKPSV